jgi:heme-degrading monooxygenase HmoA
MGMYLRVTVGRVRPGCWNQYEAAYRKHMEARGGFPGAVAIWLARSTADEDVGCIISVWRSRAEMEAYERSDAVRHEVLPELSQYLTSEFVAHHAEVEEGEAP